MASSDDNRDLKGLARSIDELFTEEDGEDPSSAGSAAESASGEGSSEAGDAEKEDVVWEDLPEDDGPRADPADADPEALEQAVDDFLDHDPLDREGLGRTVREVAAPLREAGALDPLADAVERLVRGAGDDEACIAMARAMVTPGVASRIAARLGGAREEERREELIEVSEAIGHEMAVAISDALSDTTDRFARRTFMEAMVSMGEAGERVAEEMVEDSRWFVVRNGVAILGEVGGERAVELITFSLAHTDARVRREALMALAKVGGEDAGMLVYGMIEDPDPDVRMAAAMAAGALKVERALKPLLGLLESETEDDVVAGILRALGQLGDPGAVSAIEKQAVGSFFSRPPADVRIAAYRALHHIGTPHAKSLLEDALEDKDPEVRTAVRHLMKE